ncbi:MAG: cation:proton antiporter [Eubacteriaceae bacterium]|nr:cation:proton antiporter [Eubacteriaceae bacterium]
MHTHDMIADLALMLLTAGFTTILFKKIKQPLILGYILAGFLTGPFFPLFFDVESTSSIEVWSEIGVIFLMFHIGLEFNLHKLIKLGGTPILVGIIEISGSLLLGYLVGHLMGFTVINSIFLGVMLSISSTAVIQKTFEELGVKNEKYAHLVLADLIIEDIMAIFMMVILSTISVSKNVSGGALTLNLALMLCYLAVWLIIGIFIVPTLLNKVINLMTDEMLLILSLGLCFGMIMVSNALGFSSELGAFIAGSIIAGTVHVERVEHLSKGIKDMFVAIFFLSVGMKVDPGIIVSHWPMIIILACTVIFSKFIFAGLGMLISGQSLSTALHVGFSLGPIGEFSFIIASLGISLKVMESSLYPIIVSTAILTAFVSPLLMKHSDGFIVRISKIIPTNLLKLIEKNASCKKEDDSEDSDWTNFIKKYISGIGLYGVLMLVAVISGCKLLLPVMENLCGQTLGKLVTLMMIYFVIAMFVKPMMGFSNTYFTALWLKNRANHLPLVAFTIIKVVLIAAIASFPITLIWNAPPLFTVLFIIPTICLTAKKGFMSTSYLKLETRFLRNLNERIIERENAGGVHQSWLDEELRIISFIAPEGSDILNKTIKDLNWGHRYNVFVVKLRHHGKHYILPSADMTIHADDKVFVIGDPKSIDNFYHLVNIVPSRVPRTLKEFMDSGYPDPDNALAFCAVKLTGDEPYADKTIKRSRIRDKWHCMILGLQQNGLPIVMPHIDTKLQKDDILWIMGSNRNVARMISESIEAEISEK